MNDLSLNLFYKLTNIYTDIIHFNKIKVGETQELNHTITQKESSYAEGF